MTRSGTLKVEKKSHFEFFFLLNKIKNIFNLTISLLKKCHSLTIKEKVRLTRMRNQSNPIQSNPNEKSLDVHVQFIFLLFVCHF